MDATLRALRKIGRQLQRIDAQRDRALAERNRLVIQAIHEGKTSQEIGDTLDISRERARQIAQAAQKQTRRRRRRTT